MDTHAIYSQQTNQEEPMIIEETAPNAASLSSVFPPSVSSPKKTRKLTHDLTLPTGNHCYTVAKLKLNIIYVL